MQGNNNVSEENQSEENFYNINTVIKYESEYLDELSELRNFKNNYCKELEIVKRQREKDLLNIFNLNIIIQSQLETIENLKRNNNLLNAQTEELKNNSVKVSKKLVKIKYKRKKLSKNKNSKLKKLKKCYSAFDIFLKEEWIKLGAKNLSYATFIKEMSPRWNAMSEEDKQPFKNMAKELKEKMER